MLKWIKKKTADKAPIAPNPEPLLHKLQGDKLVKESRYADAERCYRQVKEGDADYPGALLMLGFVLREQGRNSEARQALEHALRIGPEDADGYFLLGNILQETGPRDLEISHLRKAVELRPDFELARRQLIVALFQSHQPDEATKVCDAGLSIMPDSSELHFFRSNLYLQGGEKELAIVSCKRALALDGRLISAQQSLSRMLFETERFDETESSYRREIELTPEHFGPYHMLGVLLHRMNRHAEAIELFKRAIALNPASGASYSSIAAAYTDLDDTSDENLALTQLNFEKAVELEPRNSEILYNLGVSYWRGAQMDRALASFDQAIAVDPDSAKARWARVMVWTRARYPDDPNSSPNRAGLSDEFDRFHDWLTKSGSDGASFVGELQPFFLSYQEENNRALLKQHGQICAVAMQRWLDRQHTPAFTRPVGQRIRLGVISADIRVHSIWLALIKGWLQSLDSERFELIVFSLSNQEDPETAWARKHIDVFVGGTKSLSGWVAQIREQNCEILLYPGIGLDPMTLKLASLRLAPVQLNTWGHPDTSGLPTLDYYLSAESFEPEDAHDHYSEKLFLLPHLSNRVGPMRVESADLTFASDMNIDFGRPILVCPGTPYKYQPAHDHIFPEIARRVPHAQLVFFLPSGQSISNLLRNRLIKEFEIAGLDVMDHIRFIGWLSFPEFHSLLRNATVMLDTIGFSGYNTALQAIECGLPLVTREGRFLRGRLASGVLRRMDLQELIVQTKPDYINLVVRLVTDRDYRVHIRREIRQKSPVLFDDQSFVVPLQTFFQSIARPLTDQI